jgi:hypothetical protein
MSSLPQDKLSYAGTWRSPEVLLVISTDAKINYVKEVPGKKTSINAPIQKFTGNDFEAGALGMNATFVVSVPPHEENGVWKMTVDGIELTRQAE